MTIAEIAVLVIATIGYLALRMYAERQVREGRTVWLWLPNGTYIVIGVVWLVLGLQLFATSPPVAVFLATLALALVIILVWVVRLLRLVRDPEWMRPATGAPLGRPREILWLASILGILAGLGVIAFTFLVPLS